MHLEKDRKVKKDMKDMCCQIFAYPLWVEGALFAYPLWVEGALGERQKSEERHKRYVLSDFRLPPLGGGCTWRKTEQ